MMRLFCLSVVFPLVAIAQSSAPDAATSEAARNRIQSMRLSLSAITGIRTFNIVPLGQGGSGANCAIPLINAAPTDSTHYSMIVVTPTQPALKGDVVTGMPVCAQPGRQK